jgi:hypothetical protein
MAQARLTRIDAAEEMAAAVDAFRNEAMAAIEMLDMEIRRALEWIHHDRREHWDHEVRRGWERITAARVQLQQAMTARRIGERDPACIDEKKALARAQRRLELAQRKVEAVRHCTRAIDHAVDEFRGARTPLCIWLEAEAPKALATLRRMMDNLEDYVALQSRERGAGSGEQGAGSGEQEAGGGEQGAASVRDTLPLPNDAGEAPAPQTNPAPVLLPAPRSPLPATPPASKGDVS